MKLNEWKLDQTEQMGEPSRACVVVDITYDVDDVLAKKFLKLVGALRTADATPIEASAPATTEGKKDK